MGLLVVSGALIGLLSLPSVDAATQSFTQGRQKRITSGMVNSLAFTNPNAAGNLIVVYVAWNNTGSVALSDSRGNTYTSVAPATAWGSTNSWRSQVFYARNVAGGANTVTATFGTAITSFGKLYIHEYSGLDRNNPLDASATSIGTTSAMNSGSATTSNANDLIFGAASSSSSVTAAGTGFTSRLNANVNGANGSRTEDRNVTSAGSYNATATQNGARWVMHMAAFKSESNGVSAPTITSTSPASPANDNNPEVIGTVGAGSPTQVKIYRNATCSGTPQATGTVAQFTGGGITVAVTGDVTAALSARASDASNNDSACSNAVNYVEDSTSPAAPQITSTSPTSPANDNNPEVKGSAEAGSTVRLYESPSCGGSIEAQGSAAAFASPGLTATVANDVTANFSATATDQAGNLSGCSTPVPYTEVSSDNLPPGASVTAPAAGSVVSRTVTVSANASDNVGVAGVQFLLDGASLGAEDTTAPYSIQWDTTTASNGVHTLQARARDTAGNLGTSSSSVTVTVSNSAPPTPAGLVAGWAFNESLGTSVNDVSGNGNNATLQNGPTWTPGKYGGGLRFDGVNDFLTAPSSPSLNFSGSAMTLSMWINPLAGGGDQVPFAKFWSGSMSSPYYQYGLELDGGTTPHFYLGSAGGLTGASMGSQLALGQWSHLAIVFNGTSARFYVNGNLVSSPSLAGSITARDSLLYMAADLRPSQFFNGSLDDVRVYNRAESPAEVVNDLNTPLTAPASDPTGPSVSITSPANDAVVSGNRIITADASDDVGVAGVQFYVDGAPQGPEDMTAPYGANWDTRQIPNGAHTLTARARDSDNKTTLSAVVNVTVANSDSFQNQVLASGFDLPTSIEFLPDGRMLVAELAGKIKVLPPPYTNPDPTAFLQINNIGSAGVQQGIFDVALDPDFANNHYYYVFYTLGTPNVDRLSRFTANSSVTGTVPGSEFVLYQDPEIANAEHHGGAIAFGNDGKLYFTTGEHFQGSPSQDLTSPRGKVHRINKDGTVPTDNPFYDGAGPHWDSIWAYGLRNPYRAFYDAPTGRLYIGDVGGNVASSNEELDLGARGANYGWPDSEGPCSAPCTSPLYDYEHNGTNAAITGGFVYHGTQFPSSMQGNYFFADYAQHWIKRLTFDGNGNVSGVFNFEPISGTPNAGDIVYLTEGPDGALYYVDLGYSDIGGTFGVSKIRRIRYLQSNQAPVAIVSANRTSGPQPLDVTFSSAGSSDPEGQPITYSWDFGDGTSSTASNPVAHLYEPRPVLGPADRVGRSEQLDLDPADDQRGQCPQRDDRLANRWRHLPRRRP